MSETRKACNGHETLTVRTTEWMQECLACGIRVRHDLVDHPFYGFRNTCPAMRAADALLAERRKADQ